MKPDITIEERAARVDAFHRMTQGDYAHLLRVVALVVPPAWCDPSEALSEGLLAATRMYNGDASLATYVAKCAFNYALRQAQKHRAIPFTDLKDDDREDDDAYIEETLPGEEYLPYIETIDEQFISRIEEILDQSINYKHRATRPKVIALAHDILTLLRENANLDAGIGIDEYDYAPLKLPEWENQFKVERNRLQPRASIREHLAEHFHACRENTAYAMTALRDSTRQALHEGWLQ